MIPLRQRLIITALLLFGPVAVAQSGPDSANYWRSPRWFSGVRINNSLPYGTLGFLFYPRPAWGITLYADLGGSQTAASTQAMLAVTRRPSYRVFFTLGPNLEVINENPDFSPSTTYLDLVTGIHCGINLTKSIEIHLVGAYVTPAHPVKPFKFAITISTPIS